jgi:hypothetical protein
MVFVTTTILDSFQMCCLVKIAHSESPQLARARPNLQLAFRRQLYLFMGLPQSTSVALARFFPMDALCHSDHYSC